MVLSKSQKKFLEKKVRKSDFYETEKIHEKNFGKMMKRKPGDILALRPLSELNSVLISLWDISEITGMPVGGTTRFIVYSSICSIVYLGLNTKDLFANKFEHNHLKCLIFFENIYHSVTNTTLQATVGWIYDETFLQK